MSVISLPRFCMNIRRKIQDWVGHHTFELDNVNFILRTNVYYKMYIPDTLNLGCLKNPEESNNC